MGFTGQLESQQQCICQRCSRDAAGRTLITAETSLVLFSHSLSEIFERTNSDKSRACPEVLGSTKDVICYAAETCMQVSSIPTSSVPCESIFPKVGGWSA